MKKILSIAAISVFSTAALSISTNAADFKTVSFDNIVSMIKEKSVCENFDLQNKLENLSNIEFIEEILKNCECKFFGNCFPDVNIPEVENPIPPAENQKPEVELPEEDDVIIPEKPVVPENNENNNMGGNGTQDNYQESLSAFQSEILSLVNKERSVAGLSPITATNTKLNGAATQRAKEQSTLFSHTRPNGQNWTTVLSEYGVSYKSAGENVAYGQSTPKEVMTAWMNSQGHRENILNPNYKEIGIGVYSKNGTYYWAQLFIG